MNHFYHTISGYFDFEDVYSSMVERFPSGSHFVEIGCWRGRSSVYMGVEIFNSKKKIAFDCVDSWEFTDDVYEDHLFPGKATVYSDFMKNIRRIPGGFITVYRMSSVKASEFYKDESLDFVFIDGAHTYEFVKKDIEYWYPKVKIGGVIGGHDIDFEGVKKAVDEFFVGKEITTMGLRSWLHYKDENGI